ncbi:excinuclease ABC subunit UvrA [Mesomycoplasma hyorhinis]|uniref:excinuclease ABC subunit UvrA n=1 Tax=Mesomycoplasma hyorhinis TaxID=2100 RepID=UPI001C04CE6A|nr:excinuclease ABC subunit UvrA [Mesomycoplasma hyorhinis]
MKKDTHNFIYVQGAKENNLKNIDVVIPKNKLVVLTGVSGSGKSSLAFNTIYEEGKRRYVDSLSSYARQFLGGTKKPNVDSIYGLMPTISIEQKTTHNNPRSTVSTVTEIYDYFRLLYAKIGRAFCPKHKQEIKAWKNLEIIDYVLSFKENTKILILAPKVKKHKGDLTTILNQIRNQGFSRIKINEEIVSVDEEITFNKNTYYDIDIVVNRLVISSSITRQIISDSIQTAFEYSKGLVKIEVLGYQTKTFSQVYECDEGDFKINTIENKLFSFNSPSGMCQSCQGIGIKLKADFNLVVLNKKLSINQGALTYFGASPDPKSIEWQEFDTLLSYYEIDKDVPIEKLSADELNIIKYGTDEILDFTLISSSGNRYRKTKSIDGILIKIENRYLETISEEIRTWYKKFMSELVCAECKGARLNPQALAIKINALNIYELCELPIDKIYEFIKNLKLTDFEFEVAKNILVEVEHRLKFLIDVGLGYLSLNRKAETLSGGESQRIKLATQIGSNLTGILYVLDEPSIGLHQKDNQKLINSLKKMVEIGNTLLVVEHDEETILSAEHIIDIGPFAGTNGGQLLSSGPLDKVLKNKDSITSQYLLGIKKIEIPSKRRMGNGQFIVIEGAKENNLKNLKVEIPLGKFVAVTGVSGSGKSTLVNEILVNGIVKHLTNPSQKVGKHSQIKGMFNLDKIVSISQSPIGRTPRSNPATYTSVFNDIRDIFASVELARARGYQKGHFSFNLAIGRCDKCQGDGSIKIEMHFLPDVYVVCDHCEGKRYKEEILEVKYSGKSIADVLEMTVEEAIIFFAKRSKIKEKLQTLLHVGLNYIKLGQSATTLSGGEAQRVKLATYLLKKPTGKTLYVLDEPTTGLHTYDVDNLLKVLNRIVDHGDSVLVIEHNLDVIKIADYIIDLGPEGGENGGYIIATGTPEAVAKNPNSYTGEYLKYILNKNKSFKKEEKV